MDFQIRDEKGNVYTTVQNPAAVFDKDTGTLHRVGEHDIVLAHFNLMVSQYQNYGYHDMASAVCFMELPKDQYVIDKVFQNTGYIKRLYDESIGVH